MEQSRILPTVSIGIPTYNRPKGLRRTLDLMLNQSFHDVEIIISDNHSPDPEVRKLAEQYVSNNRNIRYIRQKDNIGLFKNMQFVLSESKGQYFMWAADDDEWDPLFIESCMANINECSSIMTGFDVLNRYSGIRTSERLPLISCKNNAYENTLSYLKDVQPALMYGIHNRHSIKFMLECHAYDMLDIYFVIRQLLCSNGFHIIPQVLYTAGIDTEEYQIKSNEPQPGRVLDHDSYLSDIILLIASIEDLSLEKKADLISRTSDFAIRQFVHEQKAGNYELRFKEHKRHVQVICDTILKYLINCNSPCLSGKEYNSVCADIEKSGFPEIALKVLKNIKKYINAKGDQENIKNTINMDKDIYMTNKKAENKFVKIPQEKMNSSIEEILKGKLSNDNDDLELIKVLIDKNDLLKAGRILEEMEKDGKSNAKIKYLLGKVRRGQGRVMDSLVLFETSFQLENDFESGFELLSIYMEFEMIDSAINILSIIHSMYPEKKEVNRIVSQIPDIKKQAEQNKLSFLKSFINPNELVFDIGSNIGVKAESFLSVGAKVVCVEPQPNCISILRNKFGNNKEVNIVEAGLSDKPGKLNLSVCSSANTITTFSEEWKKGRFSDYTWDKIIEVNVTTLDELIKKYGIPKYCKIDVEGFEYNVLLGLSKLISTISFEFAIEMIDNALKCITYLSELGYSEFNVAIGEKNKFYFEKWVTSDVIKDYLTKSDDSYLWGDIYARSRSNNDIKNNVSLEEIHNFNQNDRDSWVKAKALTVSSGSKVLDVGAGTCPYRSLFKHCVYETHDFMRYEGAKLGGSNEYGKIDYVSDINNIPVENNSYDVILCTEVLEHVPEPIEALREMSRIVKPGGRILITAPLGSGLHQLPFHYYGGYSPGWYRHFSTKLGLEVNEITPNGGFFKLLAQECARVAWTFGEHAELHGEQKEFIFNLFNEFLPTYLYKMDDKCFIDQFTVGYHVELMKKNDYKTELINDLRNHPKDINKLLMLVESELTSGSIAKATRYLISVLSIEPDNKLANDLWNRVKQ
ncbi:MAG: FkbM family methyltransferase [Methanococcaceae archaeon]